MNSDIWESDDPRRFRIARYFFCFARWIPIALIVVITLYVYYAYVVVLCIQQVENDIQRIVYLVFIHILLLMYASTFFRAVFTWHAIIPHKYTYKHPGNSTVSLQEGLLEHAEREELILHQKTPTGEIRYCSKCEIIKPDRAHHCTVCNRCILRMDHHCPWINNCCAYSNYKYFILFVNYSFFICVFIVISGAPYCVLIFTNDPLDSNYQKYNILAMVLLCLPFSFSTAMLGFFHIYLALQNSSTMETSHPPLVLGKRDKYAFFIGRRRNLESVFGSNMFLGFIPIDNRPGNGYEFELNPKLSTDSENLFRPHRPVTNSTDNTNVISNDIRANEPVTSNNTDAVEADSPVVGEQSSLLN
ncbi:Palmitoyltransferase ZDHHC15 isoform X1 [Oopsacas minuta]|uniref:Palmitoyltransferase n=1 Tax=Oopsacas minuta TaxID=111878 RepID=A0AAV7JVZ2_9METZ|nr:Palmitoyltransferase ZDHHC15 isoform X1 [Oopsacas minuta]